MPAVALQAAIRDGQTSPGGNGSSNGSGSGQNGGLVVLAGRCLQAAEALKAAVASCRAASAAASGLLASLNGLTGGPGGGGSGGGGPGSGGAGGMGDEDGALWVIRNILKVNQGPQGADKFAFAVMRQQMKHKFGAQRWALTGADGQVVDAVLVPCHAQYEAYSRRQRDALRGEAGACYVYVAAPPPHTYPFKHPP